MPTALNPNGQFVSWDPTEKYVLSIGTAKGAHWSQVLGERTCIHHHHATELTTYQFLANDGTGNGFKALIFTLYWFGPTH